MEPTDTYLSRRVRVLLTQRHNEFASIEEYKVSVTKDCWRFSRYLNHRQIRLIKPTTPMDRFIGSRFETVS
jgi:hypothetical protein